MQQNLTPPVHFIGPRAAYDATRLCSPGNGRRSRYNIPFSSNLKVAVSRSSDGRITRAVVPAAAYRMSLDSGKVVLVILLH